MYVFAKACQYLLIWWFITEVFCSLLDENVNKNQNIENNAFCPIEILQLLQDILHLYNFHRWLNLTSWIPTTYNRNIREATRAVGVIYRAVSWGIIVHFSHNSEKFSPLSSQPRKREQCPGVWVTISLPKQYALNCRKK